MPFRVAFVRFGTLPLLVSRVPEEQVWLLFDFDCLALPCLRSVSEFLLRLHVPLNVSRICDLFFRCRFVLSDQRDSYVPCFGGNLNRSPGAHNFRIQVQAVDFEVTNQRAPVFLE